MSNFVDHIPPPFFANSNVQKYTQVLDGTKAFKDEQLVRMYNMLNPYVNKDPTFVKRFLYEAGQLKILSGMPVYLQERLILNAYDIFNKKAGTEGLELFIYSVADGTVTSDFTSWYPPVMLMPDDPQYGFLPDGNDLITAANSPTDFLFLFTGSFSYYYGTIKLVIKSDQLPDGVMRKELLYMLIDYDLIPMACPGSCNLTVEFRKLDNTLLETLNI